MGRQGSEQGTQPETLSVRSCPERISISPSLGGDARARLACVAARKRRRPYELRTKWTANATRPIHQANVWLLRIVVGSLARGTISRGRLRRSLPQISEQIDGTGVVGEVISLVAANTVGVAVFVDRADGEGIAVPAQCQAGTEVVAHAGIGSLNVGLL